MHLSIHIRVDVNPFYFSFFHYFELVIAGIWCTLFTCPTTCNWAKSWQTWFSLIGESVNYFSTCCTPYCMCRDNVTIFIHRGTLQLEPYPGAECTFSQRRWVSYKKCMASPLVRRCTLHRCAENIFPTPLGLGLCANEFCENSKNGADASALKSDSHFLGGAYRFSVLMCLHPVAVFTVLMKFILTLYPSPLFYSWHQKWYGMDLMHY